MYLFPTLIIIGSLFFAVQKRFSVASPAYLCLVSWFCVLLLMATRVVKYDQEVGPLTHFLILVGIGGFLVGASLFRGGRDGLTSGENKNRHRILGRLEVCGILIFCAFYYAIFIAFLAERGIDGFDIAKARRMHWERIESGSYLEARSIIERILIIFRVFAILVIALVPALLYATCRRTAWIAAGLVVPLTFVCIEMGGRFDIALALLWAGVTYIFYFHNAQGSIRSALTVLTRFTLAKRTLVVIMLGAIAYVGLVQFPYLRNPNINRLNVDSYLDTAGGASVSDWIDWLGGRVGNDAYYLACSIAYFTKPVYTLDYFIYRTDIEKWRMLGKYNFNVIAKALTGNEEFWAAREQLALLRADELYSPNPWATALRDYIIDFGYIGAVFFCIALGSMSAVCYRLACKGRSVWIVQLYSLLACVGICMPFLSILVVSVVVLNIVVLLAISGVDAVRG